MEIILLKLMILVFFIVAFAVLLDIYRLTKK